MVQNPASNGYTGMIETQFDHVVDISTQFRWCFDQFPIAREVDLCFVGEIGWDLRSFEYQKSHQNMISIFFQPP